MMFSITELEPLTQVSWPQREIIQHLLEAAPDMPVRPGSQVLLSMPTVLGILIYRLAEQNRLAPPHLVLQLLHACAAELNTVAKSYDSELAKPPPHKALRTLVLGLIEDRWLALNITDNRGVDITTGNWDIIPPQPIKKIVFDVGALWYKMFLSLRSAGPRPETTHGNPTAAAAAHPGS